MAQRCTACARPDREEIDAALRAPHNLAALSRELGIGENALRSHRTNHLGNGAVIDIREELESTFPELREEPPLVINIPPKRVPPQEAFLAHYATTADLKEALRIAGVTRLQLRKWQEHDEAFQLRFHQADIEAVENLEAEARIRATAGSKMVRRVFRHGMLYEEIHEYRPSDAVLVRLLQAARPEKYGDKLTVTQTTIVKAIDAEAWEAV